MDEVVRIFNQAQVGCSRIMNAQEMAENPHYQSRGSVHAEWHDDQLRKTVKGVGRYPQVFADAGEDLARFGSRRL